MGPKVLQVSENKNKQLNTRNRSRSSSTKRKVTSPDQGKLQEKKYKQTNPLTKTENKDEDLSSKTSIPNKDMETKDQLSSPVVSSEANEMCDTNTSQMPPQMSTQMPAYSQQFLNMGSPMLPHMPGPFVVTSSLPPNNSMSTQLSDLDVVRIASILKEALKDEIHTLVKLQVEEKTSKVEEEIENLKADILKLKAENKILYQKQEESEQYSRRNNVRIGNYPEEKDENTGSIVLEIAKKSGAKIDDKDIDNSHRVGPRKKNKTRDIIVKFTSYRAKAEFIKGRKVLKDTNEDIFINDDLTKYRNDLAYEARQMRKDENTNVKASWSFNGSIFIQTKKNEVYKIKDINDLKKFNTIPADDEEEIK